MPSSNSEKQNYHYYYYGTLFIFFVIIAATVVSLRGNETIDPIQTPTEVAPAPTIVVVDPVSPDSEFKVQSGKTKLYCLDGSEVDYSVFELIPNGGQLPYRVEILNSRFESQSSFMIDKESSPFVVQVYGGETIIVKVWPADSLIPWVGKVSIPEKDRYCENYSTASPTDTPTSTNTPTATATATTTPTHRYSPATPTRHEDLNTPTPTGTPTPTPTRLVGETSTPTPTGMIATQTPTDEPKPTETPTPRIDPTSTSTDAPRPTATPTNTPIIIPRLKDCEDGVDNDGDSLVDFPDDPQCDSKNDNHEDK